MSKPVPMPPGSMMAQEVAFNAWAREWRDRTGQRGGFAPDKPIAPRVRNVISLVETVEQWGDK